MLWPTSRCRNRCVRKPASGWFTRRECPFQVTEQNMMQWSYVVIRGHGAPQYPRKLGHVCVFFFFSHFPPGPQALIAQVLECRRDGCAKGSRCEGSGSRRCQGFQRFWRVAIQWGLAVGDTTLCWYRINRIYIIITFCGHSCQPPAGKLSKRTNGQFCARQFCSLRWIPWQGKDLYQRFYKNCRSAPKILRLSRPTSTFGNLLSLKDER